jgi:hypothetical protein
MVITKADVYEKVILAERPVCPHCGQRMKIWECSETGLSCGLGWGTPYLFVCVNDGCPLFVNGWKGMKSNYGRTCSCRCICLPDSGLTEMMMVFSSGDCKPGLLDEGVIAEDKLRGTDEDPAVQQLIGYFEREDLASLQASLLDDAAHWKVRLRAAELLGELGLLQALEPLQTARFRDKRIADAVRAAIQRIHEINDTQECPHCTEIIGAEVKICTQCGRPLP